MNAIMLGLIGGALYAVSGFLKSMDEKFEYKKFLRTVVLGAIVGATNSLLGIPVTEDAVMVALSAGEVAIVENFLKSVIKYYAK